MLSSGARRSNTYHSACDNPAICVHGLKCSFQDLTTNVLIVDVDTIRRQPLQRIVGRLLLVVRGGVETKLLGDVVQLLIRANAADDGETLVLGELAHDLAHGAGSAADENGLALLGLADLVQGRIGREARHAQLADEEREVEVVGVVDLEHALPGDDLLGGVGVLGDVDKGRDQVALLEARAVGLEDLGDAGAVDGPAQLVGWRVRLDACVPHAAPHVGVEAGDEVLEDQAAFGDGIQVNGPILYDEVLSGHGEALGDLLEDEGLVGSRHACDSGM
ncbi:hypothetical protein FJTKL_14016 [Diaporthe vaccinii]|uniref:Uncharacterized protein n=1 Tax=Diaporthe vaccinii TaxID=105482 RepID=A0ABR4E9C5_9PEZI